MDNLFTMFLQLIWANNDYDNFLTYFRRYLKEHRKKYRTDILRNTLQLMLTELDEVENENI